MSNRRKNGGRRGLGRREGARGLVRSRGLKAGDTAKNIVRAKPQSGGKVAYGPARKGREWREATHFGPTLDARRRGVKTWGVRPLSVLRRVQRTTGRCSGSRQFFAALQVGACQEGHKQSRSCDLVETNEREVHISLDGVTGRTLRCVNSMVPTTLRPSMSHERPN